MRLKQTAKLYRIDLGRLKTTFLDTLPNPFATASTLPPSQEKFRRAEGAPLPEQTETLFIEGFSDLNAAKLEGSYNAFLASRDRVQTDQERESYENVNLDLDQTFATNYSSRAQLDQVINSFLNRDGSRGAVILSTAADRDCFNPSNEYSQLQKDLGVAGIDNLWSGRETNVGLKICQARTNRGDEASLKVVRTNALVMEPIFISFPSSETAKGRLAGIVKALSARVCAGMHLRSDEPVHENLFHDLFFSEAALKPYQEAKETEGISVFEIRCSRNGALPKPPQEVKPAPVPAVPGVVAPGMPRPVTRAMTPVIQR